MNGCRQSRVIAPMFAWKSMKQPYCMPRPANCPKCRLRLPADLKCTSCLISSVDVRLPNTVPAPKPDVRPKKPPLKLIKKIVLLKLLCPIAPINPYQFCCRQCFKRRIAERILGAHGAALLRTRRLYAPSAHRCITLSVTYTIGYGKKIRRGDEVGAQSAAPSAIIR